jgi:hypothetical protein
LVEGRFVFWSFPGFFWFLYYLSGKSPMPLFEYFWL